MTGRGGRKGKGKAKAPGIPKEGQPSSQRPEDTTSYQAPQNQQPRPPDRSHSARDLGDPPQGHQAAYYPTGLPAGQQQIGYEYGHGQGPPGQPMRYQSSQDSGTMGSSSFPPGQDQGKAKAKAAPSPAKSSSQAQHGTSAAAASATGSQEFWCRQKGCSKDTPSSSTRNCRNHERTMHGKNGLRLVCGIGTCKEEFTSHDTISAHVKAVHPKIERAEDITCTDCNETFTNKAGLQSHDRVRHSERVKWTPKNPEGEIKQRSAAKNQTGRHRLCRVKRCSDKFLNYDLRYAHELQKHGAGHEILHCDVKDCETSCRQPEAMEVHVRNRHTERGNRSWCHEIDCPCSFNGIEERDVHEAGHTDGDPDKQFWCREACDFFFTTEEDMLSHLAQTHPQARNTGFPEWLKKKPWLVTSKEWACRFNDCNHFPSKAALEKHGIESHHGQEVIGVFYCEFNWCRANFKYIPRKVHEHLLKHEDPGWVQRKREDYERSIATSEDPAESSHQVSRNPQGHSGGRSNTPPPQSSTSQPGTSAGGQRAGGSSRMSIADVIDHAPSSHIPTPSRVTQAMTIGGVSATAPPSSDGGREPVRGPQYPLGQLAPVYVPPKGASRRREEDSPGDSSRPSKRRPWEV